MRIRTGDRSICLLQLSTLSPVSSSKILLLLTLTAMATVAVLPPSDISWENAVKAENLFIMIIISPMPRKKRQIQWHIRQIPALVNPLLSNHSRFYVPYFRLRRFSETDGQDKRLVAGQAPGSRSVMFESGNLFLISFWKPPRLDPNTFDWVFAV